MSKKRDYHAEYLRRGSRGRHPQEEKKYGTTLPKRSGKGAKEGAWFHRRIKFKDIKKRKNKKFQLQLWADYRNTKTKEEVKNFQSFSMANAVVNKQEMIEEAIRDAQGRLGGSNWELIKIKTLKWIEWAKRKRG